VRIPVSLGTALPPAGEVITADTIQNLTKIAAWGTGQIYDTALSPDASQVAAATSTGVWVYDTASLQEQFHITTQAAALHVAFSPDGKWIASGEMDGKTHLWQAADGAQVGELEEGQGWITHVMFSPDGRFLLTFNWLIEADGSFQYRGRLWNLKTQTIALSFAAHSFVAQAELAAFAPDGMALTVIVPTQVETWDLTSLELTRRYPLTGCSAVQYSPDGTRLAVACGSAIRFYDTADGAYLNAIPGWNLAFSPAGNALLAFSAGSDNGSDKAALWQGDLATATFTEQGAWDTGVKRSLYNTDYNLDGTFSPDGQWVAINTEAGAAVYSVADLQLRHTFPDASLEDVARYLDLTADPLLNPEDPSAEAWIAEFQFLPGSQALFQITAVRSSYFARFWGLDRAAPRSLYFSQGTYTMGGVAFSPDGAILARGGSLDNPLLKDSVFFHRAETGELIASFQVDSCREGGVSPVREIRFSADGRFVVTGCTNFDTVHLWQLEPLEFMSWGAVMLPDGSILYGYDISQQGKGMLIGISPDSSLLLLLNQHAVDIVRTEDLQRVSRIPLDGMWGYSDWKFSPDGSKIAIALVQAYTGIWDVQSGALLQRFPTGTGDHIAFSPDGSILAVQTQDYAGDVIRFYRVSDGEFLYSLKTPHIGNSDGALAFSPDGTQFALALWGSVHIWGIQP